VPIFGVRGLNSGLDDAGNLAWKLALVHQGIAPHALLDSYSHERVAAARENIAFGSKSTEFMAPPHRGFTLMREAALRLALVKGGVRSLINPRQTSPMEYTESPLSEPDRADFAGGARAGMPAPESRLRTSQGLDHLTALFGSGFVALYFSADPTPPGYLQQAAAVSRAGVGALRLVCIAAAGAAPAHGAVDELGQAWQRYDAAEGTLYMIRPDGYVMGRWRNAGTAPADIHLALRRALGSKQ
jgi:3-(3-hydroxy-phenyl)propionate hydroxylase